MSKGEWRVHTTIEWTAAGMLCFINFTYLNPLSHAVMSMLRSAGNTGYNKMKRGRGEQTLEQFMYGASHGRYKIHGLIEIQNQIMKRLFFVIWPTPTWFLLIQYWLCLPKQVRIGNDTLHKILSAAEMFVLTLKLSYNHNSQVVKYKRKSRETYPVFHPKTDV